MAGHEPDLTAYRRKRHADRTPEPAGDSAQEASGDAPVFVVQRHSARRLHFDLRLEAGGVLRSWAVPKGLPTIHGRRRLAVHTEDHPMEYASFSGRIPEGEYGAGTMDVYDHGTYELLEVKRDGGFTFRLHGERLDGVWTLVPARLDGEERNWLLLAKDAPERAAEPPRIAPMLATAAADVPGGAGWLHEIKWDGFRALARLDDGEAALWSRGGKDLAERFSRVVADLGRGLRSPRCVVDGEVVAFAPDGTPSFNLLQRTEGAISYLVFDVLELEGEGLYDRPLAERRELLEDLIDETSATVRLSRTFPDGPGLLAAARDRGLEGVISKRSDSTYRSARRSRDWLKVKAARRGWFPVVGLRPGEGSRGRLGSVVVAREDAGELRYAGRAGSGLSEAEIDRVLGALEPLVRDAPAVEVPRAWRSQLRGVRWVEPAYEAEIEYAEVSPDGLLRQPRYRGLRPR